MKMELIAALIHKPKVMFLDEPTIGLDIVSQRKIREFLNHYVLERKTTIILTSHYMNDIVDLCKRAIVINQGNIVYDGDLNKVNDLFSKKKIIKLLFSSNISEDILSYYGNVKEYNGFGATIEVERNDVKEYSKKILDLLPVIDLNIEDVSIEEGISLLYQGAMMKQIGKIW